MMLMAVNPIAGQTHYSLLQALTLVRFGCVNIVDIKKGTIYDDNNCGTLLNGVLC